MDEYDLLMSPRRYQGDKRVLSMQQGGIRSTPMQPTSKKFINQVMTYHHMKHHDKKVRIAKPRIDSQMPATFKIALERKRIVEQRLSSSWSKSSLSSPDPLGSRKSTTPRENTTSRTPSPSGQRRTNERREPSPSGQRRTNERREQSPSVQRRSNERREPSPSGHRKTNERREQSPFGQRRKTEQREQSPTVNRRTNERGEQSPSGERRTHERLEQSPGDYHWRAGGRRTNNHNYGNP